MLIFPIDLPLFPLKRYLSLIRSYIKSSEEHFLLVWYVDLGETREILANFRKRGWLGPREEFLFNAWIP